MLSQDSDAQAAPSDLAGAWARLWAKVGAWRFPGPALWAALALCLLALLPVQQLLSALWPPVPEAWAEVRSQLSGLVTRSLYLVAGVVLGSGLLGTGLACATALCEFPGRRFFNWALLLPLAMPAYVLGFVVVGLLDEGGPAHEAWLALRGGDAPFLAVRSFGWLCLSLSLSLYPYVYLPARHAFQNQAGRAMEMARSLGAGPYRAFFFAALPVSLPWVGAGLALVAVEVLADIGTVALFRCETLATALYQSWGRGAPAAALQWGGFLLLLACTALLARQALRQRQGRCPSPPYGGGLAPAGVLNAAPNFAVFLGVGAVLTLAFLLPVWILVAWGLQAWVRDLLGGLAGHALRAVLVALCGAGLVVAAALALSLARRGYPRAGGLLARLATLPGALPGAALALGVLVPAAALDRSLVDRLGAQFGLDFSWLLGGGLGALLLAYLIRFLGAGFGAAGAALQRATPQMAEAARGLGLHGFELWRQVYWPLLRGGLLAAFLLAFAEIMRELPVFLLVRPAGWDGLAVRVFETALAGQWQQAAVPALLLVLAGLPPIFLLARAAGYRHGST